MDNSDLQLLVNENIEINLLTFLINLITVAILCFIIQSFYLRFANSLSNRSLFSKNFVVLGVTTCIVIVIVKNSLALSLGLVGALSIVRFRAAIKEPEELVYLFLVIATGLGAGAGQVKIISIGVVFSLIIIYLYSVIVKKSNKIDTSDSLNIAVINDGNLDDNKINLILEKIKKNSDQVDFVSMSREMNSTNINLNIKIKDIKLLIKITEDIKKDFNNTKVIVARNNDLAL